MQCSILPRYASPHGLIWCVRLSCQYPVRVETTFILFADTIFNRDVIRLNLVFLLFWNDKRFSGVPHLRDVSRSIRSVSCDRRDAPTPIPSAIIIVAGNGGRGGMWRPVVHVPRR